MNQSHNGSPVKQVNVKKYSDNAIRINVSFHKSTDEFHQPQRNVNAVIQTITTSGMYCIQISISDLNLNFSSADSVDGTIVNTKLLLSEIIATKHTKRHLNENESLRITVLLRQRSDTTITAV
jgi:hypothetical protein